MIAVLKGDIDGPYFEWPLTSTCLQYKTFCVNVTHITPQDVDLLEKLEEESYKNKVIVYPTGCLIRLYDDPKNIDYQGCSEALLNILDCAYKSGFKMVEIDNQAKIHDQFPTFEY